MPKVYLNGKLVDARRALISVYDHGFLYGDGIYEAVSVSKAGIFHWPEHYRRLRESARRIGLACPWSSATLERQVKGLVRANHLDEGWVRITLSRGPGPLGLDPRICPKPTLVLLLLPPRNMREMRTLGITLGIVRTRRNHPRCLDPQIKSNNALNTIQARREATRLDVAEAVLLNLEGHLTEGTISNVFFVRGRTVATPSLDCGLLEGVTRGLVLRLARKLGYRVQEGRFRADALRTADEVFLSSTTMGVMPIVQVTDDSGPRRKRYRVGNGRPGPITRRLQAGLL